MSAASLGVHSSASHVAPTPRPQPPPPHLPSPYAPVTQTYAALQLGNTNAALFGGLTAFSFVVMVSAALAYRRRRKAIYLLNVMQTLLLFIKTFSATIYAVYNAGQVDCRARAWLLNVPLILGWDFSYGITMIKVLLFTKFRRTVMCVIPLGAAIHFGLVVEGVVTRTSGVSAVGLCTDKYDVFYKHQYDVELILEVFATSLLLHGIASRKNGVVAATREVFRQLQVNENTRVFLAIIFVALKVLLTYGNFAVPSATTHAVDSARSAVLSWALTREVNSSNSSSSTSSSPTARKTAGRDSVALPRNSKAGGGGQPPRESLARVKMTVEMSSGKPSNSFAFNNENSGVDEQDLERTQDLSQSNDDDEENDDEEDDDDDSHLRTDGDEGGISFANIPGFDFHRDVGGGSTEVDSSGEVGPPPEVGNANADKRSSSDLV
ncbi:hypothetical protein HDU87_005916 [Geranomyces variabilis]|uniref:Uncharacterized protein n=1 Tax=Geranomyces variabilis TaxID=109894 RepID=A0AAD5TS90_9FUNG|nr:hypothetical protein HDU87_005916 [Geranomyces variabilis]